MSGDDITPGDMLRVSAGGRVFHALVRGRVVGGWSVDPVERGVSVRRVKPGDVIEHWTRASRPRAAGAERSDQRSLDDLLDR